jgi:hypothetical protein
MRSIELCRGRAGERGEHQMDAKPVLAPLQGWLSLANSASSAPAHDAVAALPYDLIVAIYPVVTHWPLLRATAAEL